MSLAMKTPVDPKALHEVRERLLARKAELDLRRHRLSADRRRDAEPLSTDAPDRAIQQQNDEVVDNLSAAVDTELHAVRAALARVESGTYGICESCGKPIGAKRLEVVPYAERCQSCAAQDSS